MCKIWTVHRHDHVCRAQYTRSTSVFQHGMRRLTTNTCNRTTHRNHRYLMYFDVNNLCGWAMCQSLPYADFRWVDDVENFNVMDVALDSSTDYILEVDLKYPQHFHDIHADLSFCPTCEKSPCKRENKLLATLHDKKFYVIHYRNLLQCNRHGLRITKIHHILWHYNSRNLRGFVGYIELNTNFRTRANNEFEKNLYKLMNNAVFGKIENVHTSMCDF